MKDEIEKNNTDDKRARAKRADLDAMQERFDAIKAILSNIKAVDDDVLGDQLRLIYKLAEGEHLEDLIMAAGRAALGLE